MTWAAICFATFCTRVVKTIIIIMMLIYCINMQVCFVLAHLFWSGCLSIYVVVCVNCVLTCVFVYLCQCVCVRMCMRACVRVCVCWDSCTHARVWVYVSVHVRKKCVLIVHYFCKLLKVHVQDIHVRCLHCDWLCLSLSINYKWKLTYLS